MSKPPTIHSHFIPRHYLRRWTFDGANVWVYTLRVPDERYPEWKRQSIRSVGQRPHLYTSSDPGREPDYVEAWFSREFEEPAERTLRKLDAGEDLDQADLDNLVRFFALQHVRTPGQYEENVARWKERLPGQAYGVLDKVLPRLAEVAAAGLPVNWESGVQSEGAPRGWAEDIPGGKRIWFEVTPGRELWLQSIGSVLREPVSVLLSHEWSLLRPADGTEWFTSDTPAMLVNEHEDGTWDFGGGWGHPGTKLMMPLTPKHLLYTQIGVPRRSNPVAAPQETLHIQRLLARRAREAIYSRSRDPGITRLRPRQVDPAGVDAARREREEWHVRQLAAEAVGSPEAIRVHRDLYF